MRSKTPQRMGFLSLKASAGWEQSLSLLKDLQSKGRTPARQKPIDKELKTDIYNFVLTVPMATTLTEQSTPCSRYKTSPWPHGGSPKPLPVPPQMGDGRLLFMDIERAGHRLTD